MLQPLAAVAGASCPIYCWLNQDAPASGGRGWGILPQPKVETGLDLFGAIRGIPEAQRALDDHRFAERWGQDLVRAA